MSDVKGQTPLFAAVKSNEIEVVKILLLSGADPEGSIENVSSPLHVAIRENFVEIVKVLIEFGANVDGRQTQPDFEAFKPKTNVSPLHMSLGQFFSKNVIKVLKISFNVH